ncbi:PQQ-binding-like beta-propeller repeat protein [uncultured Methanoregula sp.]|uniref:WD40 repeat domain-containing protein n=1 Tax=uncultured Methanoregula sp. TaxID=1005933 RepID=UPI002AAC4C62|nr:PQQ-binding-like beta-propeller repeat protein [uncultured Methanoregula sp.]
MVEKFKFKHLFFLNYFSLLTFFFIFLFIICPPAYGQDNIQYSGKTLWTESKNYPQNSISISKDGTYTAAVVSNGVTVFDSKGSALWIRTPLGDSKTIWSTAIADEGRYIVAGSADKNAYFYDKDGNLLWSYATGLFGIPGREVAGVAISRDGRSIALGEGDGTIKLLNEKGSGLWSYSIKNERLSLNGVAISGDGNYIAALTDLYNTVYLFDRSGTLLWKNHYTDYEGFNEGHGVAISGDGRYIVVGCTNGYVYCFDRQGNLLWKTTPGTHIGPVAISDDGSFVVAGSEYNNIYLLDRDGKSLWKYPTSDTVEGVSITGDGSLIAGLVKDREAFVITNPDYIPQETGSSSDSSVPTHVIVSQKNSVNGGITFGPVLIAIILAFIVIIGTAIYLDKRKKDQRMAAVQKHKKTSHVTPEPRKHLNKPVKESTEFKDILSKPEPGTAHQVSTSFSKTPYSYSPIPQDLFERACRILEERYSDFPIKSRGIYIRKNLVKATLEILNSMPGKKLPQNCRDDTRENTPDGLDLRIKEYLDSDLRTANIITDLLESVGIASNIQVPSEKTGHLLKGSQLNPEWCWEPQNNNSTPGTTQTLSEIKDEIRTYRKSLGRNPDDPGTWRTYEKALLKLFSLDPDEYRCEKSIRDLLATHHRILSSERMTSRSGTGRKHCIISDEEVTSYIERNRDFDEYD